MKKLIFFTLFIALINPVGFSQVEPETNPTNATSKIIFYRNPVFVGSGVKMKIFANETAVINLKNGSYFEFETEPGEYLFSCTLGTVAKIKIQAEEGKEYYIKCEMVQGFWSAIPVMDLVDPMAGKALIAAGGLKNQPAVAISSEPHKNHIGVVMGGGFGFSREALFYNEDNDEVYLSSGGGFTIGAEYGYEISKSFELAINGFFQGSSLSQSLSNASASFNRMGITMTPALIIPLKEGGSLNLKLGAGPGLYAFGTMSIDATDLGMEEVKLKYDPAIGFHGSLMITSFFSEHGSFALGLKGYSINYKYRTEGSSHTVTDDFYNKPKGSGIDFILGYYYHF